MTTNHGPDAIELVEMTVEQWVAAAFAAERAPRRTPSAAAPATPRVPAPATRRFYWAMLGLTLLALVLR